jgi:hypothetical protein
MSAAEGCRPQSFPMPQNRIAEFAPGCYSLGRASSPITGDEIAVDTIAGVWNDPALRKSVVPAQRGVRNETLETTREVVYGGGRRAGVGRARAGVLLEGLAEHARCEDRANDPATGPGGTGAAGGEPGSSGRRYRLRHPAGDPAPPAAGERTGTGHGNRGSDRTRGARGPSPSAKWQWQIEVAQLKRPRIAGCPQFSVFALLPLSTYTATAQAASRRFCRRYAAHTPMARSCCASVISGKIGSASTVRAASSLAGKSPVR